MFDTKLDEFQKNDRKVLKLDFIAEGGRLFNFNGFTVAIKPAFSGANMALVSTACASELESKLRRKVGEFHALHKMNMGEFMQVPLHTENFANFAAALANFFGYEIPGNFFD